MTGGEHDSSTGKPADFGSRITAGILDLFLLFLLGAFLSLAPMLVGGLALPLVGSFAAILAYIVAPCALFKKTLGMKLFGVEIVSVNGRNADATELLFRELFGRGLFGAAYFASVAVGIAGWLSGSLSFFQPTGAGLLLFLVAGLVSCIGVVGQALALVSKDGRGIADLMAKTMVIEAGSAARNFEAELDEEDRAIERAKRSKRIRNFALFEVGLVAGALLLPYGLSRPNTSHEEFADRMELKKAEREFKQDPTNTQRAHVLIAMLHRAGDSEHASEIEQHHRSALTEREAKQEAAIRKTMAEAPNWDSLGDLLRLLERQGRTDDAKAAFAEFVAKDGSATARASYGIWLYDRGLNDEAVKELESAIGSGASTADAYAYLGFARSDQGNKKGAREAFVKALEIDPELYEAKVELESLDREPNAETP